MKKLNLILLLALSITFLGCSEDPQPELVQDQSQQYEIVLQKSQIDIGNISMEQKISLNKTIGEETVLGVEINGITLTLSEDDKWRAKVSSVEMDETLLNKDVPLPAALIFGQPTEIASFEAPDCNIEVESYGRWAFDATHEICYTYFGTTCFETVFEDGVMTTYVTYSRQLTTSLCEIDNNAN